MSDEIIITGSYFDAIYQSIFERVGECIKDYKILVAPYLWLMLVNVEYNAELLERSEEYISNHKDELMEMYNGNDSTTQSILNYIITMRMKRKYYFASYYECKGMQFVEGYFYGNELASIDKMTILDIGAYIGDTMEEFFERFGNRITKYYAFEPQVDNYVKLKLNASNKEYKSKVVLSNKALGAKHDVVKFGKSQSAYGIVDNFFPDGKVNTVELEDLDSQEIAVSGKLIIKMDVEGLEGDIVRGAKQCIRTFRPYMAVCVYHRVEDIYEIPKLILDIDENYSFLLRSGVHTHLIAIPK